MNHRSESRLFQKKGWAPARRCPQRVCFRKRVGAFHSLTNLDQLTAVHGWVRTPMPSSQTKQLRVRPDDEDDDLEYGGASRVSDTTRMRRPCSPDALGTEVCSCIHLKCLRISPGNPVQNSQTFELDARTDFLERETVQKAGGLIIYSMQNVAERASVSMAWVPAVPARPGSQSSR